MKLYQAILEKIIELPSSNPQELRMLLDDLGLEVKKIEEQKGNTLYNIETLANRGDHLYALGVAREIAARNLTQIKLPALAPELGEKKLSVGLKNLTDKCLRYALLDLSLPKDMQLRSDIASVMGVSADDDKHPIVHILNYILLEMGQPMHAFDRDKIEGEISVELSRSVEEVLALDGKTYKVPPNSILIKDRKKIVAVAGVIGLANSMVSKQTSRVLIESATFDPVSVRLTARGMGISTDASYTFERGADREAVLSGLKRVLYLCAGAGGATKQAEAARVLGYQCIEGSPAEKRKISLSLSRLRREMDLPRLEELTVSSRLKHLGYQLETLQPAKGTDREFQVSVPSWRLWDVFTPEDLIEDFVRSHGMSKVKLTLPALDYQTPQANKLEALLQKFEAPLLGNGFCEVMSKGFYSQEEVKLLERFEAGSQAQHLAIKNSLERSYSHMKISNLIHLARICEQNLRRGVQGCKVFELGRLFNKEVRPGAQYEHERDVLTLGMAGRWNAHEFRKTEALEELIFLFKGVLEGLFNALSLKPSYEQGGNKLLHPGMQACLKLNRKELGFFGVMHPELQSILDLKVPFLYAQIELEELPESLQDQSFNLPTDLPSVRRDITLKVPARHLAASVLKQIEALKLEILESLLVADEFQKADEDFRRTTFRLTFRDKERTLEHSEVDQAMQKILEHLSAAGLNLAQ